MNRLRFTLLCSPLIVSAFASAQSEVDIAAEYLRSGFVVFNTYEADLNQDGITDKIFVFARKKE